MSELSDRDFKADFIKILELQIANSLDKILTQKNLAKKQKDIKKQIEILELKNSITKTKQKTLTRWIQQQNGDDRGKNQ